MNLDDLTLPMVFLSGVLGSAHCIGMCGGISATMSLGVANIRTAIVRQLFWSAGRIFTYVFLGIAAASAGARLIASGSNTVLSQAIFAILAGVLLIVQGLHAGGWLRWRIRRHVNHPCLTTSFVSQFLRGGSAGGVLLAGLLTGFLPCGLVYSFLALSASTGSVVHGALIMSCFGLGTIPVMLLTGLGFSMATVRLRQQLLRIAAVSVLVTGLMTAGRGIAFATQPALPNQIPHCPVCELSQPDVSVPVSPRQMRPSDD